MIEDRIERYPQCFERDMICPYCEKSALGGIPDPDGDCITDNGGIGTCLHCERAFYYYVYVNRYYITGRNEPEPILDRDK